MLATTIQITNNPPHTPTPKKPSGWLRRQPPPTGSGRSHGVEREPDSVSARYNIFMPNPKHAPTPTTHIRWRTCAGTRKQHNTPTTQASTLIVPHKNGLPRKEVIQPHLPVRLPCYDFVPIANPTFDHSPRKNG